MRHRGVSTDTCPSVGDPSELPSGGRCPGVPRGVSLRERPPAAEQRGRGAGQPPCASTMQNSSVSPRTPLCCPMVPVHPHPGRHPALHPSEWAPRTRQSKSEFISGWFLLRPSCDPLCGRLPVSPAGHQSRFPFGPLWSELTQTFLYGVLCGQSSFLISGVTPGSGFAWSHASGELTLFQPARVLRFLRRGPRPRCSASSSALAVRGVQAWPFGKRHAAPLRGLAVLCPVAAFRARPPSHVLWRRLCRSAARF